MINDLSKYVTNFNSLLLIEKKLLIYSLILLPVIALSLKLFGYKRTQWWIRSTFPEHSTQVLADQALLVKYSAKMVSIAAKHGLIHASCLQQSLLLWCLLKRKGIEAELRIGVKKQQEIFLAHSWVELYGKAIIDNNSNVQEYFTLI